MTLLHGVPDRVLWSLAPNEILQQNLLNEAKARGIGSERLVFADRLPTPDHMARHAPCGFVSGRLNYNAHATASEAVWSGVPLMEKAILRYEEGLKPKHLSLS